jgi:hypothetical protein
LENFPWEINAELLNSLAVSAELGICGVVIQQFCGNPTNLAGKVDGKTAGKPFKRRL